MFSPPLTTEMEGMLPEAQNCVHSFFLKDDFILKNLVNYGRMFDVLIVSIINRQRMTIYIINMAHNAIPMIAFRKVDVFFCVIHIKEDVLFQEVWSISWCGTHMYKNAQLSY